jgi:Transposase
MLDERTVSAADDDLVGWALGLGGERLWALEDCRQLTRALERDLLAVGEELVRALPKLMAPERRAGRLRGKSDPIDALAVARAALREPNLSQPRPDEQPFRQLKLLVDHREDLVDERRRGAQQRLRWQLHQLDPSSSFRCAVSTGRCTSIVSRPPRTQTRRRQEPPRSDPLPQTTTRTRRLQHAESESRLDKGATLAQPNAPRSCVDWCCRVELVRRLGGSIRGRIASRC